MDTIIYGLFTISYAFLLCWGLYQVRNDKQNIYSIFLPLVTLGLVFDNLVILLGKFIGAGDFLETVSTFRYWIHAFFTPTLVLFSMNAVHKTQINWSKYKIFKAIAWLYTILLVLLELFTATIGLQIAPKWEYGILHYVPKEAASGPPLMVIGLVIWILVSSIIVWKKQGWIWMFIGTLVMIIGSSIPINVKSSAVMNGFELLFITSLWVTKVYKNEES